MLLFGWFKDYIVILKFNFYQLLYMIVIGFLGWMVEIQICMYEMYQQVEYGVVVYWMYKEWMNGGGKIEVCVFDMDMVWFVYIFDWQVEIVDLGEFFDLFWFEIGVKEVYVFMFKGRVIGFFVGVIFVDFVYVVYIEIGYCMMGVKVNGCLVFLELELKSGDVVEVFMLKNFDVGLSQDWFGFVVSMCVCNKICGWFIKECCEEVIEQGKEVIVCVMC